MHTGTSTEVTAERVRNASACGGLPLGTRVARICAAGLGCVFVHAYLAFLAFGSTLALFPSIALADDQAAVALEYQGNPEPSQINERKARTGAIMSSLGIVLSTVGIIAGGVLVAVPECRWQGDYCGAVSGAEKKNTAGKALLVISPISLGASIFGLVRSKRTLDKAHPKTSAPREPASWRRTRD